MTPALNRASSKACLALLVLSAAVFAREACEAWGRREASQLSKRGTEESGESTMWGHSVLSGDKDFTNYDFAVKTGL